MKVLVSFIETVSDNHQGGAGKSFVRRSLVEVPIDLAVNRLYGYVLNNLKINHEAVYDKNDVALIRINSIEIFE